MQPESASSSEIHVVNSTFTQGTINITINNTPLEIPDASHPTFSLFSAFHVVPCRIRTLTPQCT